MGYIWFVAVAILVFVVVSLTSFYMEFEVSPWSPKAKLFVEKRLKRLLDDVQNPTSAWEVSRYRHTLSLDEFKFLAGCDLRKAEKKAKRWRVI